MKVVNRKLIQIQYKREEMKWNEMKYIFAQAKHNHKYTIKKYECDLRARDSHK